MCSAHLCAAQRRPRARPLGRLLRPSARRPRRSPRAQRPTGLFSRADEKPAGRRARKARLGRLQAGPAQRIGSRLSGRASRAGRSINLARARARRLGHRLRTRATVPLCRVRARFVFARRARVRFFVSADVAGALLLVARFGEFWGLLRDPTWLLARCGSLSNFVLALW